MGKDGRMRAWVVRKFTLPFWFLNFDGFVKSSLCHIFVIPAQAGIHPAKGGIAFAGVTAFLTFYEIINIGI